MKKTCAQLIILVVVAFILLPVCVNGQNVTNSTVIPTNTKTTLEPLVTTQVPAEKTTTIPVTNTTLVLSTNTTPQPGTTAEMISVKTAMTSVPAVSPATQMSTGNVSVASSPLGASILIDGVYYGTTLGNFTGIPAGNHIMRLTLSGYYDYEGTIYIVPGQVTHVFGTLPPLHGAVSQPVTLAPVITIMPAATTQPTQTASGGAFESPTVVAAVIGVITACIGAGVTLFTHISKVKKE